MSVTSLGRKTFSWLHLGTWDSPLDLLNIGISLNIQGLDCVSHSLAHQHASWKIMSHREEICSSQHWDIFISSKQRDLGTPLQADHVLCSPSWAGDASRGVSCGWDVTESRVASEADRWREGMQNQERFQCTRQCLSSSLASSEYKET